MRFIRCFILCLVLLLLPGCRLQNDYSGKIIVSGQHRLAAGEVLDGDLVVLGGAVELAPGSVVRRSIHIFDGRVVAAGKVQGSVTQLGGALTLQEGVEIDGGLNLGGGETQIPPTTRILGQVTRLCPDGQDNALLAAQNNTAGRVVTILLEAVLLVGLAYLSERYLPGQLDRIGQASSRYFLACAALGVLSWVIGLALLVLMAYTIILIPVSLLGFVLMLLATSLGAVPFARRIGRWLGPKLGARMATAGRATALGMFVLVVVLEVVRVIPWFGGSPLLLILVSGFGAVLLTRFGFRTFVANAVD